MCQGLSLAHVSQRGRGPAPAAWRGPSLARGAHNRTWWSNRCAWGRQLSLCPRSSLERVTPPRHNGIVLQLLATISAIAAVSFPHGTAAIRTPERSVTLNVELARTPAQLHTGLSG